MRAARHPVVAVAAAWLLVVAACSGPTRAPEPDPRGVVALWHRALSEGRPGEAWELLHPTGREGLDKAAFVALYQRDRDALVKQAETLLRHVEQHPPGQTARVELGGTEVTLTRTEEGWRLDAPVSGGPPPERGETP